MTHRPALVLVTGPPGTGKSTLADCLGEELGGTVLGWDWAMAALTWCPPVQAALESLDRAGYRRVGWSILWNLAEAQLRRGRAVVLDGVARTEEVERTRELAGRLGAVPAVALTACTDRAVLRARIEGRSRGIPGWHELGWDDVAAFLDRWQPPGADVVVDTAAGPDLAEPMNAVLALLAKDDRRP